MTRLKVGDAGLPALRVDVIKASDALGYDDAAARALLSGMHCSGPGEAPLLAP